MTVSYHNNKTPLTKEVGKGIKKKSDSVFGLVVALVILNKSDRMPLAVNHVTPK